MLQGGHVGGQYNRTFSRQIYLKMELSSQKREMLLFLAINMADVTSRAIQQYSQDTLAPVVQTLDSALHRINHYLADSVIDFCYTFPLDSDLSGG